MSEPNSIRFPPLSRCVECGRELPAGALECSDCFAPGQDELGARDNSIEVLLRRSRARLLFGLVFLGWVLPFAYLSAQGALRLYRDAGLEDGALLARIDRHRYFAVGTLFLWAGIWIAFLLFSV